MVLFCVRTQGLCALHNASIWLFSVGDYHGSWLVFYLFVDTSLSVFLGLLIYNDVVTSLHSVCLTPVTFIFLENFLSSGSQNYQRSTYTCGCEVLCCIYFFKYSLFRLIF